MARAEIQPFIVDAPPPTPHWTDETCRRQAAIIRLLCSLLRMIVERIVRNIPSYAIHCYAPSADDDPPFKTRLLQSPWRRLFRSSVASRSASAACDFLGARRANQDSAAVQWWQSVCRKSGWARRVPVAFSVACVPGIRAARGSRPRRCVQRHRLPTTFPGFVLTSTPRWPSRLRCGGRARNPPGDRVVPILHQCKSGQANRSQKALNRVPQISGRA